MSKNKKWEHIFENIYYVPVPREEIFEMEFYIKTRDRNFATFLNKPVTIELHFKPNPFWF